MRTVPAALQTHLDSGSLTICRVVAITLRNGTVKRFAEHQADLSVSGQTYTAAKGIRVSSIKYVLNSLRSNVDFEVIAEDGGLIDPDDIRNGLYDKATVLISAVNYANTGNGVARLWQGEGGQTEFTDVGKAKIQAIGMLGKADKIPIEHYTPTCRAEFGDSRCGVSMATWLVTRTITAISGFNVTLSSGVSATRYKLGLIIPTSGVGLGEAFEIRSISGSVCKMYLPVRGRLEVGDSVQVKPGCDYTMDGTQGCRFWENAANFVGEPHVPGADATRVSLTESWG